MKRLLAMTTIFGRPDVPITEPVDVTLYGHAAGVLIGYPTFYDWQGLYDPHRSWPQKLGLDLGNLVADRQRYADGRRSHEHSVTQQLEIIYRHATGRAVFAEMRVASPSAIILPFEFRPVHYWKPSDLAVTYATDSSASTLRGAAFATSRDGQHRSILGTGSGSDSPIYFTASRVDAMQAADDILLHELVHASRKMKGVSYRIPLDAPYGNQEEFLANVVQNIYRSEDHKRPFDYKGGPINPGTFLDTKLSTTPRLLLSLMRKNQPTLFAALTKVQAAFNPIQQVDAEEKALVWNIEHK
jgi:hypothetical protein